VAIKKKVPVRRHGAPAGTMTDITLPVFSYQNDKLADLIVAAWANVRFTSGAVDVPHLGDALKDRDPHTGLPTDAARATATEAVNFFANMDLTSAVIITEEEHDDDYTMQDPKDVVFVLPNQPRITLRPGEHFPTAPIPPVPNYASDLLETAKLLMACTPNGI